MALPSWRGSKYCKSLILRFFLQMGADQAVLCKMFPWPPGKSILAEELKSKAFAALSDRRAAAEYQMLQLSLQQFQFWKILENSGLLWETFVTRANTVWWDPGWDLVVLVTILPLCTPGHLYCVTWWKGFRKWRIGWINARYFCKAPLSLLASQTKYLIILD